jgi:AcrR family transcriptional regulator
MRQEVKDLALRQLAEGGATALSINAVAKELGVSGPALYRYFPSRDALLTELIIDAYRDLTAAIAGAGDFSGLAAAYRAWAVAQPHRYRLLFGAPLPGYDAHDVQLVAAAQGAMAVLLAVAADSPDADGALKVQLEGWQPGVPPGRALAGVSAWTRMHGLVSLEIEGNYASMGIDPDLLFRYEIDRLNSGR